MNDPAVSGLVLLSFVSWWKHVSGRGARTILLSFLMSSPGDCADRCVSAKNRETRFHTWTCSCVSRQRISSQSQDLLLASFNVGH